MIRSTDALSHEIINLIDERLLVPEDQRLTAPELCEWFGYLLSLIDANDAGDANISDAVQEAIEIALKLEAEEVQDHLDSQSKVDRDLAKNDATYLQVPGLAVPIKTASSMTNGAQETTRVSAVAHVNLLNGRVPPTTSKNEAPSHEMKPVTSAIINNASSAQRQKTRRYCVFHAHYADKNEKLRDELDEGQVKSQNFFAKLRSSKSQEKGSLDDERASAQKPGVLRSIFSASSPSKDRKLARYIRNRDLVRWCPIVPRLYLIKCPRFSLLTTAQP